MLYRLDESVCVDVYSCFSTVMNYWPMLARVRLTEHLRIGLRAAQKENKKTDHKIESPRMTKYKIKRDKWRLCESSEIGFQFVQKKKTKNWLNWCKWVYRWRNPFYFDSLFIHLLHIIFSPSSFGLAHQWQSNQNMITSSKLVSIVVISSSILFFNIET